MPDIDPNRDVPLTDSNDLTPTAPSPLPGEDVTDVDGPDEADVFQAPAPDYDEED